MLGKLKTVAVVLTTRTWITYVQLAGAVVLLAANELAEVAPDGSEEVVKWLLWFGTVLTEAVVLVRSHSRVPKSARGLVLPDDVKLTMVAHVTRPDGLIKRETVVREPDVDVRRPDPPQAPPRRRKSGD